MTPLFTINFRREAYLQEVARRRRRVLALGAWVAYYGVLALVLGLYGLNSMTLARRAAALERQTGQLRRASGSQLVTALRPTEMTLVERYTSSTRRWRDRLERVGDLMPSDAHVSALNVNPQNMSDAASRELLVISGELRSGASTDRMQGVMKIVATLRNDPVFRTGYKNIRLASTRGAEDGTVEFVIECR